MAIPLKEIDANLIKKYNYETFMYTEYPHKSFWSKEFHSGDFKSALKSLFSGKKDVPLMLYVHIPFCKDRCFYCTCHTLITSEYKRIKDYLKLLFLEIDLFKKFFAENSLIPNFREIHIGGGSPTFLRESDFDRLIEKLQEIADIKKLSEFSTEIDPREADKARMRYYHRKGINRVSFGVQDFDLRVQMAINRVQPPELIERLLTPAVRKYFSKGVNFDIICGLPLQTTLSIKKTFERIVRMSPERICFNYLHYAPNLARHQMVMSDGRQGRPSRLPDFQERKMLFQEALRILLNNGYVRTGYDHFAKPTDDVAKAMEEKTMRWNALGVTAGRYFDVIGIGLHSYSTLKNYYFQNVYELSDYETAVKDGRFPVYRGHKLSNDDLIRRDAIQMLRNFFILPYRGIEEKYNINFKEYFKEELVSLSEFSKDGILEVSGEKITVMESGYQFVNLVSRNFDKYLPKRQLEK